MILSYLRFNNTQHNSFYLFFAASENLITKKIEMKLR